MPTGIRSDCKEGVSTKSIIAFIRKCGGKSMAGKFALEIMDAFDNQGGVCERREDMHRVAEVNRTSIHFRS